MPQIDPQMSQVLPHSKTMKNHYFLPSGPPVRILTEGPDRFLDRQIGWAPFSKRCRTELTVKNRFFQIDRQFRRAPLRTRSLTARRDLALRKSIFSRPICFRGFPATNSVKQPTRPTFFGRPYSITKREPFSPKVALGKKVE